jgi:cell shape-determining protein MreD
MTPLIAVLALIAGLLQVSLLAPLDGMIRPDILCVIIALALRTPRTEPLLVGLVAGVAVLEVFSDAPLGVLAGSFLFAATLTWSLHARLPRGGWRGFLARLAALKTLQVVGLATLLLLTGASTELVVAGLQALPAALIATLSFGLILYRPLDRLLSVWALYGTPEETR